MKCIQQYMTSSNAGIMEADTSDLHFVSSELNASIDNKYEIERNNKEPELNAELQKEMPIDEILAIYECSKAIELNAGGSLTGGSDHNETYSSSEEEILSNQDLTLDKDLIARDLLKNDGHENETSVHDLITSIDGDQSVVIKRLEMVPDRTNVLSSSSFSEEFEDEDSDYEDGWMKKPSIGPEHQAELPECNSLPINTYAQLQVEEQLLWNPSRLSEDQAESYCREVEKLNQMVMMDSCGVPASSCSSIGCSMPVAPVKDDEQALYSLLQLEYNMDEALRRRQMQVIPPTDPLSLWSQEECRNFINGLRLYGKDFFQIQQNKVRTRAVSELVHFYYLWKKTDQYAIYSKKKVAPTSTVTTSTDFSRVTLPDEFSNPLQDHNPSQDHNTLQDPLSSPGIHSLLYTDAKRQLHDINLDVGQKWTGHGTACPSEVDFSNVVRPNFDAISVTSSGLDPSFLYHNLYGELALPTSAFASQVYADGFPELYYQPNYTSRKRSSDGQLLTSEGDDYICPSIDSPLKRFKSSEVYPVICMTAGFSSNLVDDFNEFPEDTSAHRVGCYSSCSKQVPRMDPPKDSNDALVGAHSDTLTMTDTGLYSYGNAIQNTTKMLAQ